MPHDLTRLIDMLNAARRIQAITDGLDWVKFEAGLLVQEAVAYHFIILGEAARNVSDEFRAGHPEISWRDMIGMRNIQVHEYSKISLDIVWGTIQNDIPALIAALEPLVPPDEARGE